MKDSLLEEIEDLQLFADPFEEFTKSLESNGWTANFVRKGKEIAIQRESNGTIRTLRGLGQRRYRNLKGLLVSEAFANLGGLALPVPHNFLLDFMRPLRYGGQHGDSESGLT